MLCELLRAGLLKDAYHSDHGLYELRTLVSAYQDVVTAGIRALNQKKALTLGHRDKGKSASLLGRPFRRTSICIGAVRQCQYIKVSTRFWC
jgi:hypothetical protein